MRRIRNSGRDSFEAGQHSVHHRGEEQRPGWNLVGEQLSWGARRRGQPFLLLQLRAQQRLDALFRQAARAAELLHHGDGQARSQRPWQTEVIAAEWDHEDGMWTLT